MASLSFKIKLNIVLLLLASAMCGLTFTCRLTNCLCLNRAKSAGISRETEAPVSNNNFAPESNFPFCVFKVMNPRFLNKLLKHLLCFH